MRCTIRIALRQTTLYCRGQERRRLRNKYNKTGQTTREAQRCKNPLTPKNETRETRSSENLRLKYFKNQVAKPNFT